MSTQETPSRRYQRLSLDEQLERSRAANDDSFDKENAPMSLMRDPAVITSSNGTSGGVTTVDSNPDSIFRTKTAYKDKINDGDSSFLVVDSAASTMITMASTAVTSRHVERASSNGSLHLRLSQSQSDSEDSADLLDSDWEEDDEAGLRRYHLNMRNDVPLPLEFSHVSFPKRIWLSFLELRTAARQRRAARLLELPSGSWKYKLQESILTWCCDATDGGILLVVCWLSLWFLVGLIGRMGSSWWIYGLMLFIVRVTARPIYEWNRKRARQRLVSTDSVELGRWSGLGTRKESNVFQQDV